MVLFAEIDSATTLPETSKIVTNVFGVTPFN